MDLRLSVYICAMLWLTVVAMLLYSQPWSAILLAGCAGFVSGQTFQIWCCERRNHGRLP